MMPKIPLTAQEAGCWISLDVFRPSHPTANFCQAPACIFRDKIGRLIHEHSHCAYLPLLKAFEILSLNLIRQQFTTDLCHIPVLLAVTLTGQMQYAWIWWWFITPINTATTSAKPCIRPTAHMMLLSWICKTHMTGDTQGFGEARPPNSSMMGAACCARQRRDEGLPREVPFHLRAVPMLQLAGDSAAPGVLSHQLRVALIYAWLQWPSKGCLIQWHPLPSVHLPQFPPKPGFGQRSKDYSACIWHISRSQLYRRL